MEQESSFSHWAIAVEQDGLTWWMVVGKEPRKGKRVRELSTPEHYRGRISAFTVGELGEMLPFDYVCLKYIDGTWIGAKIRSGNSMEMAGNVKVHTEADARAKMLIYLIEQQIVTLA